MTDLTPLYLGYAWAGIVVLFFIAYKYRRPKVTRFHKLLAAHIDEVNGGM